MSQFALNEDHIAIRDMALDFAREKIAPHALEWDEKKHFPVNVIRETAALGSRTPDALSGGQRQRVAIARALALAPAVLALDEPTSSLDRTAQRGVVDLLARLQAERGLAYLFVTHDLGLARALADDVLVMRAGRIVERGPAAEVFATPSEVYTRELIEAADL